MWLRSGPLLSRTGSRFKVRGSPNRRPRRYHILATTNTEALREKVTMQLFLVIGFQELIFAAARKHPEHLH
jgi:hypothetical protein